MRNKDELYMYISSNKTYNYKIPKYISPFIEKVPDNTLKSQ